MPELVSPERLVDEAQSIVVARALRRVSEPLEIPEDDEYFETLMRLTSKPITAKVEAFNEAKRASWLSALIYWLNESRGVHWGVLELEVVEGLKGSIAPGTRLHVLALFEPFLGTNRGPAPYVSARPGAASRCYAFDYREDRNYLLFTDSEGRLYARGWRLAPINEELGGVDDPWLRWVRARLSP